MYEKLHVFQRCCCSLFEDPELPVSGANVTLPHKCGCPPCCYYLLCEIKIFDLGVISSDITFVPDFM